MRTAIALTVWALVACGTGTVSAQDIDECNSDLGIDIFDVSTATDTIEVDPGPTVGDVDVSMDIEHTWQNDLLITVDSPGGTTVSLYTGEMGPKENADVIVTWDDEGVAHGGDEFNCDCAMEPAGSLADFDGEDATGDWTVSVLDRGIEDEGIWNEWCLVIAECLVDPIVGLGCVVDGEAVTLTWDSNEGFDEILVLRDGEEIFSLTEEDDSSVIDDKVPEGPHSYEVIGNLDSEECFGRARCDVNVGLLVCDDPGSAIVDFEETIVEIEIETETSVRELQVVTEISHTFYPDLVMNLESPGGTELLLYSTGAPDVIGFAIDVTWSDAGVDHASEDLDCGCSMQPFQGEMADFAGDPANGTWALSVRDTAFTEVGTIDSWCVDIEPCDVPTPVITCTVVEGDVEFAWEVDKAFSTVAIFRDGELLEEIPGDSDPGYTDVDPGQGLHVYEIRGISDTEDCYARARCSIALNVFCDQETYPLSVDLDPAVSEVEMDVDVETELEDLDVAMEITHTFYPDLEITLESPAGTVVTLYDGASPEDVGFGMDLIWDDDGSEHGADDFLCDGCAIAPVEPLSGFFDEDPSGTWTLTVEDLADGDDGSLDSWCLIPTLESVDKLELRFIRGDANNDGSYAQIGDPIFLFQAGFVDGAPQPPCEDAADFNGDGSISFLGDGLFGLQATFVEGSDPIPAPHPDCDVGEEIVGCETPPECSDDP